MALAMKTGSCMTLLKMNLIAWINFVPGHQQASSVCLSQKKGNMICDEKSSLLCFCFFQPVRIFGAIAQSFYSIKYGLSNIELLIVNVYFFYEIFNLDKNQNSIKMPILHIV